MSKESLTLWKESTFSTYKRLCSSSISAILDLSLRNDPKWPKWPQTSHGHYSNHNMRKASLLKMTPFEHAWWSHQESWMNLPKEGENRFQIDKIEGKLWYFLSGHCFLAFLGNLHSWFLLSQKLRYVFFLETDIFFKAICTLSCFNFAPLQRLARPRFSWRGGYKDGKFVSRTLSNVSVNSIFLKFGTSHCVSLHREIFVPNIIHEHGFLHCSMLSVLSTLFVQIFLKFSLEIHFFFLVS